MTVLAWNRKDCIRTDRLVLGWGFLLLVSQVSSSLQLHTHTIETEGDNEDNVPLKYMSRAKGTKDEKVLKYFGLSLV